MPDKRIEDIFNYKKFTDRISTSGQPLEDELEIIIREGFEVVIYLALLDSKPFLPTEPALLKEAGGIFEHIPVVFRNPLPADFTRFCEVMEKHREKKCFIHCEVNMRVSVFMALYHITVMGWSYDQAMAHVYDIWKPNDIWNDFIGNILNSTNTQAIQ